MTCAVSLDRARVWAPLMMAGACAAAALCVYVASFHLAAADHGDLRIYFAFFAVLEPDSKPVNDFVGLVDPARFVFLAAIPPAIAVARGRPLLAAVALGLIGGATLTTEILKEVVVGPRPAADRLIAWPSGHMTAATALALAFILVVPERSRAFAAVAGALWLVAIGSAIMLLGMHFASDVVSGVLIAGAWAGLALAALHIWPAHGSADDEPGRWRVMVPVASGALVAVTAGALATALAPGQDGGTLAAEPLAIAGGGLVVTGVVAAIVAATAVAAPVRVAGSPA